MIDTRIIKTKQNLYNALGRLLQEKSFDKITVSEIVKEAHTTRKTFYNHYQDKIDMVQEYQTNLSRDIQSIKMIHNSFNQDFFVELFSFLDNQDKLLTALLSYNGSAEIQGIIKGTIERHCRSYWIESNDNHHILEYQSILMANAIFGIVQHWLITGKKTSPVDIAQIICALKFPL
jgi:AcrR family transcriptional regulator